MASLEQQDLKHDEVAQSLTDLVDSTSSSGDHSQETHIHTKADQTHRHAWIKRWIPEIEKLANREHVGNYVMTRGPNPTKKFEAMPIYARLGMHLLFVSARRTHILQAKRVEELIREQSIKQGKLFDSEQGALQHIQEFIRTYELEETLKELAEPDPAKYKTFNSFFYRHLKPGARPAASPEDPKVITSAADCRLTVFDSVSRAKEIWIKGKGFTIPALFEDESLSQNPAFKDGASIAIFRLAPADYHRFHSPVDAVLGPIKSIDGQYYTVNPQAVNEDFDVFTVNRRDVLLLNVQSQAGSPPTPVAFVAVGAMLVGSIGWSKAQGDEVKKGEELGYFAYGGSTVIGVFPNGSVQWDEDLLKNSLDSLETEVKVGERIGVFK